MLSSTVCSTSRVRSTSVRATTASAPARSAELRAASATSLAAASASSRFFNSVTKNCVALAISAISSSPTVEIAAGRPSTCARIYCWRTLRRVITARRTYAKIAAPAAKHRSDMPTLTQVKDETISLKYAERLPISRWVALEIAETEATNAALVC